MNSPTEQPNRTSGGKPSAASEDATILPSPAAGADVTVPPAPSASITAAHVPSTPTSGKLPAQLPAPFGRYRMQKLLGQGGMGAVYLAHDSQLDRPVALKIPLFASDEGSQVLARFYREARSAATILHANVCPVYDVGEVDGVPYLTMGYIEGKSLAEWLRSKPITPRQSAALVRKLALALQEAHKKGVIHRDLKPANIMIDKRGEPVIMDFGLARRDRPGDARLTQTGAVMGTPAYMPPEQVSGKVEVMGPACDIYSLGVILYELVAGRLPFQGDPMAMLSQVLLDEPPPPSQLRPGLDKALESICLKAMAKKIEDRYASMTEFAAALQDYLRLGNSAPAQAKTEAIKPVRVKADSTASQAPVRQTVVQAAEPTRITKVERKPARRPRQRALPLWVWLTGGAAVMLLGGLILLLVLNRSPSSQPHPSPRDGNETRAQAPEGETPQPPWPQPKPAPPAPPAPTTDGFVPLFNGKDLSGWEIGRGDPTVWRVENGAMIFRLSDARRQKGWLVTERDYSNFLLRLDFQFAPGANSSIGLRMWPGSPKPPVIQLLDDTAPSLAAVPPTQRTGTLFGVAGQPAELRPLGEWNHLEIELVDWSLRVAVNDKETVRTQLNEDAVFRYLDGAPPASGRIGLEHNSGSVRFRNLQIKDLSETPVRKGNP